MTTRTLLTCGIVAAPLWAAGSLAQAATREGYSLLREPLSMLATGPLGWIQIVNFIVSGVLSILGAIGLRRVLGASWAPRLVLINGAGMIAAGIFTMDSQPYAHMAAGTITFGCLVAACYLLGKRFGWRSLAAGSALLVGDLWAMSGAPAGSLTLAVGAIAAMMWISVVSSRYRQDLSVVA
ncbi:DUF998 domain-containing protein [Kibdelosporangium phytohabitans]|uniref:DUF998 domain-containing protein n=1 Tax=Kibdelosporangium phytohabitans TaxID=860235 RepID=A0A0N7F4A3_9PSEU|nr:DUF998 domain-containing protein [Kibdelosporangium phytohabitans]ALG10871.1 hypothetical protein AOZ06_31860 [Kibdelosporangium phytohabitans]MBE1462053.1 hypothetical protein [Kibdelosporangium phytohabitans]